MKFGKRSDSDAAAAPGATDPSAGDSFAPVPPAPDPPDPPVPPVPESPPPVAEYEAPGAPAEELPVVHAEPVVDAEAYEVPADEPPETLTVHQHEPAPQPAAMPFPVAEQPVSIVTPGPGPAPVTTLGASGEAFASGHAAGPRAVGVAPSWQEPMQELADERPELVVAAAFVGGLLAAMILRRLGR